MKFRHAVLVYLLFLAMGIYSQTVCAETRDAGVRSRIVTQVELRAVAGTVQKIIYLEALSMMGDVGEGGGGLRKWQQEFQTRYQRRLKTNSGTTSVQAHEGRLFAFARRRMPVDEFARFEIKTIVEFRTRSHGVIGTNNVYNYHLRELTTSSPANRPDVMLDLISLETIEGIMIPSEEITDVTVEFKARP